MLVVVTCHYTNTHISDMFSFEDQSSREVFHTWGMPRAIFGNSHSCFPWQPILSVPHSRHKTHIYKDAHTQRQRDRMIHVQRDQISLVHGHTHTCTNAHTQAPEETFSQHKFSNFGAVVSSNAIIKGGQGKDKSHTSILLLRTTTTNNNNTNNNKYL